MLFVVAAVVGIFSAIAWPSDSQASTIQSVSENVPNRKQRRRRRAGVRKSVQIQDREKQSQNRNQDLDQDRDQDQDQAKTKSKLDRSNNRPTDQTTNRATDC